SGPKRDWTQYEILTETQSWHTGYEFFNVLHDVCDEAFGGQLGAGFANCEFPMGNLTIGQLLDFTGRKSGRILSVEWKREAGGPAAYVLLDDDDAADFTREFGIEPSHVHE